MSASLHTETAGEAGPLVVLQHGFAGSARNWRPQVRALRGRARTVTFDARGHARSAALLQTPRYALADFVRDFGDIAAAHARADERIIVGGLSLGAAVALHYALAAPDRLDGLVLAAIPAGQGSGAGFASEAEAFADALERDGLEAAGERFVWGPSSGLDADAAKWVRMGFREHPPTALASILRQTIAGLPSVAALAPRLAGLTVPTLVLVGDRDRSSLESSRALAAALPDARLVIVEDAGHVVNLAQPRRFAAALAGFLDERAA